MKLINQKIGIFIFLGCVYNRQNLIRYIYYFKNFLLFENKKKMIKNSYYSIFYNLPFVREKVKLEITKFNNEMKLDLEKKNEVFKTIIGENISENGLNENEIFSILNNLKNTQNRNLNYVSGAVYNNDNREIELVKKILPFYFKSNPLHPDLFPEISFLERTIIKSVSTLFNGNKDITFSLLLQI